MSIGLDEKLPQDYRLAQQVCHTIANISDSRKVWEGYFQTKEVVVPCPPSTDTHPLALLFLAALSGQTSLSLPAASGTQVV